MVLNKLFGKKKDNYFFEAEDNNTNETETAVEATTSIESVEATTNSESSVTSTASISQTNVAYDVPDWVKAIKNYSNQDVNNGSQPQEENFAGKYITNNVPFSRRRPGPSLAPFKSMASKISK